MKRDKLLLRKRIRLGSHLTYDDIYESQCISIEGVRSFSEGLAAAQKNNLWGYINREGDVVIDFQYDEVEPFNNGLAQVMCKGQKQYIDAQGNCVWRQKEPIPKNQDDNIESKEVYANEKLGFEVDLPQSWEGKYLVEENNISVEFIHRNEGGEGSNIIYISIMPMEKWLEAEQYMYQYLGTKNDNVYLAQYVEAIYDIETEEGLKKALEINQLRQDIDLSTAFRLIE